MASKVNALVRRIDEVRQQGVSANCIDVLNEARQLLLDMDESLAKAHESRIQAQEHNATLKAEAAQVRGRLRREMKEQGWTPPPGPVNR